MAFKFAVGATVHLKSGGPAMSVKSLPTGIGHSYICQWFAGKKLEQGSFAEETLDLVVEKEEK